METLKKKGALKVLEELNSVIEEELSQGTPGSRDSHRKILQKGLVLALENEKFTPENYVPVMKKVRATLKEPKPSLNTSQIKDLSSILEPGMGVRIIRNKNGDFEAQLFKKEGWGVFATGPNFEASIQGVLDKWSEE